MKKLKLDLEVQMTDIFATDDLQIEIQSETGFPDRLKLYIHRGGRTIVRVCKIKPEQITIEERWLPFFNLS